MTTISTLLDIIPKFNEVDTAENIRYTLSAVNMELIRLGFKLQSIVKTHMKDNA